MNSLGLLKGIRLHNYAVVDIIDISSGRVLLSMEELSVLVPGGFILPRLYPSVSLPLPNVNLTCSSVDFFQSVLNCVWSLVHKKHVKNINDNVLCDFSFAYISNHIILPVFISSTQCWDTRFSFFFPLTQLSYGTHSQGWRKLRYLDIYFERLSLYPEEHILFHQLFFSLECMPASENPSGKLWRTGKRNGLNEVGVFFVRSVANILGVIGVNYGTDS